MSYHSPMEKPPPDPADHAKDFAHRYTEPLDQYCAIQMQEIGIPEERIERSRPRYGLVRLQSR